MLLPELLQSFQLAIIHQDNLPAGIISGTQYKITDGLAVYRGNWRSNMRAALADNFPVVKKLTGDEYFYALADAFMERYPPQRGTFLGYGLELADFLSGFPGVEQAPYLPDVARLEYAWLQAYNAAEGTRIDIKDLPSETLLNLSFTLHPSCQILTSPFPILEIWQANQNAQVATTDIPLHGGSLLIHRPKADVIMLRLTDSQASVARCFMQSTTLAQLAEQPPNPENSVALAGWLLGIDALTIMEGVSL